MPLPSTMPSAPPAGSWRVRAMSVLHYLVAQGVDRQRLRMVSYADTQPLLPNTSEANRARIAGSVSSCARRTRRPVLQQDDAAHPSCP